MCIVCSGKWWQYGINALSKMHCYTKSVLLALTLFWSAIRFAFKKITVALLPFNISVPEIQCNVLTDALTERLSSWSSLATFLKMNHVKSIFLPNNKKQRTELLTLTIKSKLINTVETVSHFSPQLENKETTSKVAKHYSKDRKYK